MTAFVRPSERVKNCIICGSKYYCSKFVGPKRWSQRKFCSNDCYNIHRNNNDRRSGKNISCIVCGQTRYIKPSDIDRKPKFCSHKCMIIGRIKPLKPRECGVCGKTFTPKKHREKGAEPRFCSRKCGGAGRDFHGMKGKDNPRWKGGITPKNMQIRQSLEYRQWIQDVFKRDDHTCQSCGQQGGNMNAHHILPFCSFSRNRTELDNGITLCESCHKEIHRFDRLNAITD